MADTLTNQQLAAATNQPKSEKAIDPTRNPGFKLPPHDYNKSRDFDSR